MYSNIKCVVYQWIRLNELYKLIESFFSKFEFVFQILAENRKMFKKIERREYWSNCNVLAIYQWICLNELYNPMKIFFQISN